ncbi:ATP-binding protein [Halovenus marina]|uniref:ATP-binding protein n=1 Tax=Halovenus marina TaxID=3396621 RepID=UPI003F5578CC
MALSLGDGWFAVAILSGVVLCWLGIYCYRRWDEPGVTPFAVAALFLGIGAVGGSVLALAGGTEIPDTGVTLWLEVSLMLWVLAVVPWILFALQYTGRYTRFRLRTIALVSFPVVGIVVLLVFQSSTGQGQTVLTQVLGTIGLLYVLALVAIGCYLLLRTTQKYGHLSLFQGVSLTLAGSSPLIIINSISILAGEVSDSTVFAVYSLAFVTPAVTLLLAVFRHDMFESTPAAGALGERAIPRETDDLVFVVDTDGRIIKINETAVETLDASPSDPLGDPFDSLVSVSVDDLQSTETVELETVAGMRKFDPQITTFTDQHGRPLGSLVSLRDVTERELRKQRLEVLNRVLRHNLRNKVDVIKSNAEAVAAESDSEHTGAILDSADELATLSAKARSTDQLVSHPTRESRNDLSELVSDLTETDGDVDITLDIPESAPLVTDWEALRSALSSAIRNAVEYAEESVTVTVEQIPDGYRIVVEDDGPGIPESELASIDAESETPLQHGTGLGLWQLRWGITKLNGNLSFDTQDGTVVRMTIPDLSA